MIKKKRLRASSFGASPNLYLTFKRMTPRVAGGVWAMNAAAGIKMSDTLNTISRDSRRFIESFFLKINPPATAGGSDLKIRAARKLQEWQTHSAHENLIGANGSRRRKPGVAPCRNQIILIDAVAANSDCADQHPVLIQRRAPRKNLDAIR